MKIALLSSLLLLLSCSSASTQEQVEPKPKIGKADVATAASAFSLDDYYSVNPQLDSLTNAWYASLNDTQRIAQTIMTSAGKLGKADATVKQLVANDLVGGVIFLKGSTTSNKSLIDDLNASTSTALWYAIDAEPSLFNSRLSDAPINIDKTINLKDSMQVTTAAHQIDSVIKAMGLHINFAPVVDLSPNNEAIKDRSFGSDANEVIQKSTWFVNATQSDTVAACIKHFPGHGYVTGDTHKQSVYIDGELKELGVYPPLIEAGAVSAMVAHVAVENNAAFGTNGIPASCSRNIVTDLLRDSLGFEGVIFTDAMNMMAAVNAGESGPLAALKAGCDIILMPPNEQALLTGALELKNADEAFAYQLEASIKRVLRLKLCLGLSAQ